MRTVFQLEVTGHRCGELVGQLNQYHNLSLEAKNHFLVALTTGSKVALQDSGGKCENNPKNSKVTISWDACKENGTASLAYLGESALFELVNSRNSQRFLNADKDLKNNNITILEYGLIYARLESEATVVTAKILNQLQSTNYLISEWGRKQRTEYYSHLANFAEYFMNQPHSTETGVNWKKKLKTKHMYAFDKIKNKCTVSQIKTTVLSIAKELAIAPPNVVNKLWSNFEIWCQSIPQLICSYIYALQALENNGRKVTWASTTAGGTWVDFADDLLINEGHLSRNQKVYEIRMFLDNHVFTK